MRTATSTLPAARRNIRKTIAQLGASRKTASAVILSASPDETRFAGEELSRQLQAGDIVYLKGQLGSGKTTLVQGMFKGLHIKDPARSSSFMLVNEYRSGPLKLYHMDLYRLEGADMETLGLEEYLNGGGVCIIEWAEKMKAGGYPAAWEVRLSWRGDTERAVRITRKVR